jgi:4'-phosphopantetheinyl transferase
MIQIWRIDAAAKEDARAALRIILEKLAGRAITLDRLPQGKPYLPAFPHLKFNFSHTKGKALVAVTEEVEVGVDIERLRPMPDVAGVAERFLPPGDAEALAGMPEPGREREFFRRWTRAEALWKAAGVGLYGAGQMPEGEWHVVDVDAGEGYAAAVASNRGGVPIRIADFETDL